MKNIEKNKINSSKLGYYLAGLIEGDGHISTSLNQSLLNCWIF
jgi:hypothetical protein